MTSCRARYVRSNHLKDACTSDNFHPPIRLHPMVGVKWDLAGVACLNGHALVPTTITPLPETTGNAPHVVVRSPVALKPQTLHNRFLASRYRDFIHPNDVCRRVGCTSHHFSAGYFANVGATTRSSIHAYGRRPFASLYAKLTSRHHVDEQGQGAYLSCPTRRATRGGCSSIRPSR